MRVGHDNQWEKRVGVHNIKKFTSILMTMII